MTEEDGNVALTEMSWNGPKNPIGTTRGAVFTPPSNGKPDGTVWFGADHLGDICTLPLVCEWVLELNVTASLIAATSDLTLPAPPNDVWA